MGSARYKRNRLLKCDCGGYPFPHRIKSGACHHNPNFIPDPDWRICTSPAHTVKRKDK